MYRLGIKQALGMNTIGLQARASKPLRGWNRFSNRSCQPERKVQIIEASWSSLMVVLIMSLLRGFVPGVP